MKSVPARALLLLVGLTGCASNGRGVLLRTLSENSPPAASSWRMQGRRSLLLTAAAVHMGDVGLSRLTRAAVRACPRPVSTW